MPQCSQVRPHVLLVGKYQVNQETGTHSQNQRDDAVVVILQVIFLEKEEDQHCRHIDKPQQIGDRENLRKGNVIPCLQPDKASHVDGKI